MAIINIIIKNQIITVKKIDKDFHFLDNYY